MSAATPGPRQMMPIRCPPRRRHPDTKGSSVLFLESGFVVVGLALLAGCTQTSGQIEAARGLPQPQVVIVEDFAVSADQLQLDPGLSGTIGELVQAKAGTPRTAEEQQVGGQVADALAAKLVTEIQDLGLPAQRGSGLPAGVTSGQVISGQFASVDQGNQAERVAIGLGAGRSDVRVHAQVFEVTPGGRRLVDEVEGRVVHAAAAFLGGRPGDLFETRRAASG